MNDSPTPRERLGLELKQALGLEELIGRNPRFLDEVRKLRLVAGCDVSVLISGDTGTGKELCGRAVHYLGPRASGPFVAVDCGAIPLDLVENELFGHERSAYTGAESSAPGLVREAEGGTLFLDEIDTLPVAAQAKLLRFLQEREYRPLGSSRVRRADVRVVAATNSVPEEAVKEGRLRRDLYYRLSVVEVRMPPLRERREDIPALADHFLRRSNRRFGTSHPGFSQGAIEALTLHDWPGNVRELEHAIERAVVLRDGSGEIRRHHLELPEAGARAGRLPFREAKARAVAEFERSYVSGALTASRGNITRAASAVGKDRKSFWELIRKHGIEVSEYRPDLRRG
jgi:DNA-binding NtrC family response regulator